MATRTSVVRVLLCGILPFCGTGCIIVADGSWRWGPTIWTTARTESLALPADELKALDVRTHNGWVHVAGQAESTEASVTVTKKTGGITFGDAAKAMEALEVFAEPAGEGAVRLGYRWKGVKSPTWRANVSFDIQTPADLGLAVESHNGEIEVNGIRGDVVVETHNGRVKVASSDGKLRAATHNGNVTVNYTGGDITLISHNGRISGNLGECGQIRGNIRTHNGGVEVAVGERTSAELTCETYNGGITFDAPVVTKKVSRRQFVGTLGDGGQPLDVTTHNGSIRFKKTAG